MLKTGTAELEDRATTEDGPTEADATALDVGVLPEQNFLKNVLPSVTPLKSSDVKAYVPTCFVVPFLNVLRMISACQCEYMAKRLLT